SLRLSLEGPGGWARNAGARPGDPDELPALAPHVVEHPHTVGRVRGILLRRGGLHLRGEVLPPRRLDLLLARDPADRCLGDGRAFGPDDAGPSWVILKLAILPFVGSLRRGRDRRAERDGRRGK